MIFEIDLLNDDNLYYVNRLFDYLTFVSGEQSNALMAAKGEKSCKTSYEGNYNIELQNYIEPIIYEKVGWELCLTQMSRIHYSKFSIADHYGWHYDSVPILNMIPHYSMTCFLNDDYEGGELEMQIGDSIKAYKLSPGKAVFYPTKFKHRVTKVTSGTRKVFCSWLRSGINDTFLREQYMHIIKILEMVDPETQEELLSEITLLKSNVLREGAT
tara:strand:+ start:698 stop:1339 length:642 start_codon:yes stop_codon:yes gene_type:complete